jgi:hypothetical protein
VETRLPGEADAETAVARRFATLLARADRLLAVALEIISQGGVHVRHTRGIRMIVLRVVFGLYGKACKTYRAIRVTVARGLGEDAFILGRALFETAMAILFILRRDSVRRSRMYLAHLAVNDLRMLEALARTRGTKRIAKKNRLVVARARVQKFEQELGPSTIAALKSGPAGMSVEATAKKLGRWEGVYQLFYRRGSRFGHVADLSDHVQFTPEGVTVLNMVPSRQETLEEVLRITYGVMWGIVAKMNERLGLGHDDAVKELAKAVREEDRGR